MSLINDPDYLIHSLRLGYLRNVDDPYGPRIVTFSPSYASNPYILAASLADVERWPELTMPSSPNVSDDESERPNGFPGATGLKYTQTIMGNRSGGMGLRVSGRRASRVLKRSSGTPKQNDVKILVSENTEESSQSSTRNMDKEFTSQGESSDAASERDGVASSPPTPNTGSEMSGSSSTGAPEKVVQFIPKFKGAAEMEARRRMRMLARRLPGHIEDIPPPSIQALDPDLSSSDEEAGALSDHSSDEDDFRTIEVMDGDDEFDPDFAAARAPGQTSDSASELLSVVSGTNSGLSNSNPLPFVSSNTEGVSRMSVQLSPGAEAKGGYQSQGSGVQHLTEKSNSQRWLDGGLKSQFQPMSAPSIPPDITFPRRKVPPIHPLKSALTDMLAKSTFSSNPFAEMYAAISGRSDLSSVNVQVYFPRATQPSGKAMELNVRKDATIEEVIGFGLWTYWEDGWLPKLDEAVSGEEDPKLSAVGWIMRIAEEDGEVDDEFPPPDRTGKISKFNFDAYAILEATQPQVVQNQILESKIQRRPSRTMAGKKPDRLALPSILNPGPASFSSPIGSLPLSASLGPSSSHGPQIFLRIRVADTADAVHISTTIPVSAGMYMQEALELVCRKRKLDPKDYALLLSDMSILIPLDRTVASLQGKRELVIVKRSMLPELGIDMVKSIGRTTDPNASIFKRISDVPEMQYSSALDLTAAYKKYTVYRKMPMLSRQERTFAVDGVYIHIMPSTNKAKAVFENPKTASFHIKSIAYCQQSTKTSSIFKLVVNSDGRNKRYDFEAETPKLANEIVGIVRGLKASLERSGTMNKSRRSRQVN